MYSAKRIKNRCNVINKELIEIIEIEKINVL